MKFMPLAISLWLVVSSAASTSPCAAAWEDHSGKDALTGKNQCKEWLQTRRSNSSVET
jgi:hypothetical protein